METSYFVHLFFKVVGEFQNFYYKQLHTLGIAFK